MPSGHPSSPCHPRPRPRGLLARLDRLLDRSGGPDACWPAHAHRGLSRGQRRESEYPVIRAGGKGSPLLRVNRLVLLLEEIPEGVLEGGDEGDLLRWVLMANRFRAGVEAAHGCDNSRCGNPAHLEWAAHGKNVSEQAERRARAREAA